MACGKKLLEEPPMGSPEWNEWDKMDVDDMVLEALRLIEAAPAVDPEHVMNDKYNATIGNEVRLIDANALIEHIKGLPTWCADGGGVYGLTMKYPEEMFLPEDVISSIENAPTIM